MIYITVPIATNNPYSLLKYNDRRISVRSDPNSALKYSGSWIFFFFFLGIEPAGVDDHGPLCLSVPHTIWSTSIGVPFSIQLFFSLSSSAPCSLQYTILTETLWL